MRRYESDVCIIGGGISAALLAQKLLELRPSLSITAIEAGRKLFDFEKRAEHRRRSLDYAENPWPGDFVEDQAAKGIISRTMAVGGSRRRRAMPGLRIIFTGSISPMGRCSRSWDG